MSAPQVRSDGRTDPNDLMVLLFGGMIAGPAILAFAWTSLVGWLTDHHVLVDAAHDPLVVIPASEGAGLDLPRLLLLGALVLGLLAFLGSVAVRVFRSRAAEVDR
ncbi:hypothetical protein SAMN05661080_04831 [Modestobacter sp. DSM 44400]|uniref:hypothetical protein n=1 Tax=Modestobacter sp. DSM 44400 TaxID=1550230 RepID=UPI0008968716|nr:hypothetical protein [Modestobacter sp. DSM 44400]SDY85973.1 hypothetical protein SAMN05661080_04831 [Modestobacter sp. DSM 44400]